MLAVACVAVERKALIMYGNCTKTTPNGPMHVDWNPMYTAPKTGCRIRAYVSGLGDNSVIWAGEWVTADSTPVVPTAWARYPDIDALPNGPQIREIIRHSEAHPQAWINAEAITNSPDQWICNQAEAAAWAANEIRDEERVEDWRSLELHKRPPAAQGALMALLGWDDCGYMLELPVDALRDMVYTGPCDVHYKALLIAPAVIAMRK